MAYLLHHSTLKKINSGMARTFITSLLLLIISVTINGQAVIRDEAIEVANRHMESFFPDGARQIKEILSIDESGEPVIYSLLLEPEGWLLISGNKAAEPVIGYSLTGTFSFPEDITGNSLYEWIGTYEEQIIEMNLSKDLKEHPAWSSNYLQSVLKGTAEETITVAPFIEALWNQGSGWNIFCPEDEEGPGGHAYVGCVAVAMAQAMSVYHKPDTGIGYKIYDHDTYGNIIVDYNEAEYDWANMSMIKADSMNALLLYHSAVAVDMNFGPDASSAYTSATMRALRNYFGYSDNMRYLTKSSFESEWADMIIEELIDGRPLIYKGGNITSNPGWMFRQISSGLQFVLRTSTATSAVTYLNNSTNMWQTNHCFCWVSSFFIIISPNKPNNLNI